MATEDATLPARWWQQPDLLREQVARHGTMMGAARAVGGVSHQTLSVWWARHGFAPLPTGTPPRDRAPVVPVAPEQPDDQWVLDALKRLGDTATVEQIADLGDVPPRVVRDAVARLDERGYRIDLGERHITLERKPPASDHVVAASPELFDGDLVRFGVVSDTHLCSKECHLEDLHTAYEMLRSEGISWVLHPGDLVAGMGIYKHQIRDLAVHGFDAQVDYAVANYPRVDGIETWIVGGNHDLEGDYGRDGADPVKAFCSRRDDFTHLGDYSARVALPNGGDIHVLHPGGGSSYALSYRAQKIAEGYEGGTKPSATLFGHWHRRGDFTARGINLLLCGTFEGSTSLAKRYGLGEPAIGFHIVTCRMADDGSLVRWNPEWFPFFRGRVVT